MRATSARSRAVLAAQQRALVAALLGGDGSALVAGIDPHRLEIAARQLAAKRRRAAQRSYPRLFGALGASAVAAFEQYAKDVHLPHQGGPLADARGFARWLAHRRELPVAGWFEAFRTDLIWRSIASGLTPRRLPVVLLRRIPGYGLALGAAAPRLGAAVRFLPWSARRPAGHNAEAATRPAGSNSTET